MNKVTSIVFLWIFASLAIAQDISDEKKRVIDDMLEITGALEVGEQMGVAAANQMITALSSRQELDPKVVEVLRDEVGKIMHDEFIANGFIQETSYQIYDKYFTTEELIEVVEF